MKKEKVREFYKPCKDINNHRYKSWERCRKYFLKLKNKDSIKDKEREIAQLHLGFYLASWGMYRGSSFVLQKDYTIYSKIVDIALDTNYDLLWNIESNLDKKEKLDELFQELYGKIEEELLEIKGIVKKHDDLTEEDKEKYNYDNMSPKLVTKIIFGTIGCIPAYDSILKNGLSSNDKIQKTFNHEKSFKQMLNFYEENKAEIDDLQQELKDIYTPMKVIDMYFWEIGKEMDEN